MKKQTIKQLVLTSFCWASVSANADTLTLLDQNFDAGIPASAQTLGGSAVNLRSGTDTINTYNSGNPLQRFSLASGTTFFNDSASNKFLVMGDDSGQLAGNPTSGTFGLAVPFALAHGTTDITVSFDWVFSAFVLGGANGSTDRFNVGISGAGFDINTPLATTVTLLDQSIPSAGKLYGPDSVTLAVAGLGAADANGKYWLSFGLLENTGTNPTTNSAVGIDNIKITAHVAPVPLPTAIWTFLSSFMGLLALGKRNRPVA